MSGIGSAIIGGSAITGLLSANAQKSAAQTAANAQLQANQQALAAQQANNAAAQGQQSTALASGTAAAGAQNNSLQALLSPFVGAGAPGISGLENYANTGQAALGQQANLTGANGAGAQSTAIDALRASPTFQALLAQQNDGALQAASAAGGLRNGNTTAALAQLDPALLNNQIQQQLANLTTLSGQGSAASSALASLGAGAAGTQASGTQQTLGQLLGLQGNIASNQANIATGNNSTVSQLLTGQGAIQGQNALAQGQADSNLYGGIGSAITTAAGLYNKNNLASLLAGSSNPANSAGLPLNQYLPNGGYVTGSGIVGSA